jgi:hypothetical protein
MVAAELFDEISETHVRAWQNQWRPYMDQARARYQKEGDADPVPEDAHWSWDEIIAQVNGLLAYKKFSIFCNNQLQGMMLVNMSKTAKAAEQSGKELVYVELLATAPWNRKSMVSAPKYQGVGRLLIATAVELSVQEEFKGRIGLHSLPASIEFYRNACAMKDLGPDPNYQNLHYFEMTETQAKGFRSR